MKKKNSTTLLATPL